MKILFVGNSYTFYNDMPKLFERLMLENGYSCEVLSVTKGGRKLFQNVEGDDETAVALREAAEGKHYGVLFIQEQSMLPITDKEAFMRGVSGVCDLVNAERVILYATWGRKSGADFLKENNLTTSLMARLLDESYTEAAKTIGAEVSRVGLCFLEAFEKHSELELYNPDLSHPSYLGSCVAAMVHFATLTKNLPERCESLGLDEYTETTVKNILKNILKIN